MRSAKLGNHLNRLRVVSLFSWSVEQNTSCGLKLARSCTRLTKSEEKERLLTVYVCLNVPTLFSINSFVVYKFHRKPFCCCLSVISWGISTQVYNVAMSKNLVVDIGRELFLKENLKKIAKAKLNKDNVLEVTAISPKI